jgi:hypothetical protein
MATSDSAIEANQKFICGKALKNAMLIDSTSIETCCPIENGIVKDWDQMEALL